MNDIEFLQFLLKNMKIIQFSLVILCLSSFCLNWTDAQVHCSGSFRQSKSKLNGKKYDYCWIFFGWHLNANNAASKCKMFGWGRLTTVATKGKAWELSRFIKENIHAYASGERSEYYLNTYKNGWPNGEVWVSSINDGRWDSTQQTVTNTASQEANIKKHGSQCVVFSHAKSTWRYADCSEKHLYICEESGHMHSDDVNAENLTTPSFTLPPTNRPKGLNLTCPKGYDEFHKHCFYIGKVRGSSEDAEKTCYKTGGTQVWISDSSKDQLVRQYYQANKVLLGVWLGSLTGNGYIVKWKGTGTNAKYVLNTNKLNLSKFKQLSLKDGMMPKLFFTSEGSVSWCKDRCLMRVPFCESAMIVPGSRDYRLTSVLAAAPTKPTQSEPNNKNDNRQESEPSKSTPLESKIDYRDDTNLMKPSTKSTKSEVTKPPTKKPLVVTESTKKKEEMIKDPTRLDSEAKCPEGFDKFWGYCFYVSRYGGYFHFAMRECKQIGGRPLEIYDLRKQKAASLYLKHTNLYYAYAYLPAIKHRKSFFKWRGTGNDASYLVESTGYIKHFIKNRNTVPKLIINYLGGVSTCKKCGDSIKAFCEPKWPGKVKPKKLDIPSDGKLVDDKKKIGKKPASPKNQVTVIKKKKFVDPTRLEASERCPEGFEKFRMYCFFISRKMGELNFAKSECKHIGGRQVEIYDIKKRRASVAYFNHVKDYSHNAWIPAIERNKSVFTWKGTGNDASYLLKSNAIKKYIRKFKKVPKLVIGYQHGIISCRSCLDAYQAFCEPNYPDKVKPGKFKL